MKVAIVCDWLTNQGGGERVVLELHRMFPEAPIYTSVFNPKGSGMDAFKDADIRTSFIQRLPRAKTRHQLYPVLRQFAFGRFKFDEYDIVISSSGAEAKGIITKPPSQYYRKQNAIKSFLLRKRAVDLKTREQTSLDWNDSADTSESFAPPKIPHSELMTPEKRSPVHINYCHSPTHYYWVRAGEYLRSDSMGIFGSILRLGLRLLIKPMRRRDYLAAQRPDYMIANSTLTQKRIREFYDREAKLIFPPVDIERFTPPHKPPERHGFVSLGRQVHYMRRDIAVLACSEMGLLLRVIGRGPQHEYLKSIAGPTIEFYDDLTDDEVAEALWHAEGLVSCGVEDFGITAAEALAAGCPVIAYRGGGKDIVKDSENGWFFDKQTPESLMEALSAFDASAFNAETLTQSANTFSAQNFREQINAFIALHSK